MSNDCNNNLSSINYLNLVEEEEKLKHATQADVDEGPSNKTMREKHMRNVIKVGKIEMWFNNIWDSPSLPLLLPPRYTPHI